MNRLLTALAVLAFLTACSKEPEPAANAVDIEAGKRIAEAQCSGCHDPQGAGKTPDIPNLAAQPVDYLVDAMHAYRSGRRHHAALQELIAGFKEADIRNIAAYFSSLPPVPVETKPEISDEEKVYQEGAEFAAACEGCHGKNGVSTTPGVPSLAGQQPVYLMVATQEYRNGSRSHEGMDEMLKDLDAVDLEKMAMFFSAQAPSLREPPPFGDPQRGEALSATCGACHGEKGISHDPMIPSLAGQEATYLVDAIKAYRDHKRSHEDMVADKSDQEIEDIAAYYSIQAAGSLTDTGEELETVVAKCERCHGRPEGESKLVLPKLYGQKRDYLLRVMKEYRDGSRGSSMMHNMSYGYSDELLEQLADWYSTHSKPE